MDIDLDWIPTALDQWVKTIVWFVKVKGARRRKGAIVEQKRLAMDPILDPVWQRIKGGLIVSCQAPAGTAIDTPEFIRAQALTVEAAGAAAIRAEGLQNIRAVTSAVSIPVIGLIKSYDASSDVYITPRAEDVLAIAEAGADIVAVDATQRARWNGQTLENFYEQVRALTNIPLLADIDSKDNAKAAIEMGFNGIATTLSGYTNEPSPELPNLELVKLLSSLTFIPVIAEGGFANPKQVKAAIADGAWAVCVGTAITNPYILTKHFIEGAF